MSLSILFAVWQWLRLRLLPVVAQGWWYWALLAMGLWLGGCRNQYLPIREHQRTTTTTTSRDTLIKLQRLNFSHVFDTLPLDVPVVVMDSSRQVRLELTRKPEGLAAAVGVQRQDLLVPRVSTTRTDTLIVERMLPPPKAARESWWQRLWPGVVLGILLVVGVRLLLK